MICGNMAGRGAIGAKPCGNGAAGIGCGMGVICKLAASDDWKLVGLAVGIKVGPEKQSCNGQQIMVKESGNMQRRNNFFVLRSPGTAIRSCYMLCLLGKCAMMLQ